MTLADRIEVLLRRVGPLPLCTIATEVRKRKSDVLAVLEADPRFIPSGRTRGKRWHLVETGFALEDLALRWRCSRSQAWTLVHGAEGFLERGYLRSVDGNGTFAVTELGLHWSAVLHGAK